MEVKKTIKTFKADKVPLPPSSTQNLDHIFFPLHIEIGGGSGMFALNYSKNKPDVCLVSFERTKSKFEKFKKEFDKNKPKNLIPIHGDAIRWITHFIKEDSVDKYFILYPNLYVKKKQENLRFSKMPFTSYLIKTLKNKGQILLATNSLSYFDEFVSDMTEIWGLKEVSKKLVSDSPRSLFEKKFLQNKEKCYEVILEK